MTTETPPVLTAKKHSRSFWILCLAVGLGLVLVMAGLGLRSSLWSDQGRPVVADAVTPQPQLRGTYDGALLWNERSLRIRWEERGTLDNDGDHDVVVISGGGLRLRAVWGWMAGAGGRVGARAEIDQAVVPPGWPTPVGLVVERATPAGGWEGRLETREKEAMILRLDPSR